MESRNTINLDGVQFRTTGPVQSMLASVYPAKVVTGDTTRDSQVRASVMSQSDWRGGIGLFSMEANSGIERLWWSTCNLRSKHMLTLPRLATVTAAATAATVGVIIEYANEIYATFGTAVHKYNNATNSWGTSLQTLGAAATSALVARVNNIAYLVIATTSGVTYFDGSTWTNNAADMVHLAWWDDKVWGLDSTGRLRFNPMLVISTDAVNWANDALLPLENGFATGLFVGEDAAGNSILYAATKVGLFAHDFAFTRFIATKLQLPRQDNNGQGATRWRDTIYFPSGLQIYNYTDGSGQVVISLSGPDQDDGLPADYRGVIRQLVNSNNELICVIDGTSTRYSTILGWDGTGWQVLWVGSNVSYRIDHATVAGAYDVYRLWWAENQRVYWMELPREIINPNQATDFDYAASGTAITPWFSAGQIEVDKLGLYLCIQVADTTTTETITISHGTDLSETWTEAMVLDDDEIHIHRHGLPSMNTPKGLRFDWIRFRITFARGNNTKRSPKLQALTLIYRKKLPVRYGFTVEVDLREAVGDKSPAQLRSALVKAIEAQTLVPFTFRADDAGTEVVRSYWVDVISATNLEETGLDESGISRLTLAEA